MKIIVEPKKPTWAALAKRPSIAKNELHNSIQAVFSQVQKQGDKALINLTHKFDGVLLNKIMVDKKHINSQAKLVDKNLKQAIDMAYQNIHKFHAVQLEEPKKIETQPGVVCWRQLVGIDKVGLYIPGGTAPLFSTLLMLGIPAIIAGCKHIVVCTPPQPDGALHPTIAYVAKLLGLTNICLLGGAQAIAAMTLGTATVSKVYKIFGPGNQYVTAAKQAALQLGCAIDMPAGPSEVCVYADGTCEPKYVAADLLSQAEHGADSQVILVTNAKETAHQVQSEVNSLLKLLPRKKVATQALKNSKAIVFKNQKNAVQFINLYAAEHLILAVKNYNELLPSITNAGSIFLGNYTPEAAGDYISGTNHTLPTNGYALMYSGVSVDSFVKKITVQQISKVGIQLLAPNIATMARAEGLEAHAIAAEVRIKK
jgi:histidinol dehydrogenase